MFCHRARALGQASDIILGLLLLSTNIRSRKTHFYCPKEVFLILRLPLFSFPWPLVSPPWPLVEVGVARRSYNHGNM